MPDSTETTGGDWKRDHANASEEAAQHELVDAVLSEFADNMRFAREGLPEYGLQKIVSTVAQVVRARTLGFDPELLRLTDDKEIVMTTDQPRDHAERAAAPSEREAAFKRAFPLRDHPSFAELNAHRDWRVYFNVGWNAALSASSGAET